MHRASIDSDHFDPMPRSTSPGLFAKHHSQASRAADISRLLDPSYSSSSSSSSNVCAYLDHNGDLHDPDYRYFPVATPTKRPTSPHSAGYNMSARPRWELMDEDALDLEDEDYDYGLSSRVQQQHTNKRHKRDSFTSYTTTTTTTRTYTPTPHSFDSDDSVLDECEEYEHFVMKDRDPRRLSGILRSTFGKRRASSLSDETTHALSPADTRSLNYPSPSAHHHPLPASPLSPHSSLFPHYPTRPTRPASYQDWDREDREKQEEERREREREVDEELEQQVWTPTCTQALKREWQAVTLRIRFSVFRTQRKIKSRFL
jgi:hypothetical protein